MAVLENREKCGIAAVINAENASFLVRDGLKAEQGRGQESAGIASAQGRELYIHQGMGLVPQVFHDPDILRKLEGFNAIGQVRYSTTGESILDHCQPIHRPEANLVIGHNGNLPTTIAARHFLERQGRGVTPGANDSGIVADVLSHFLMKGANLPDAVRESYTLFRGSFSIVAMTPDSTVAFRDRNGIRPAVMGGLGNGYAMASESHALDMMGANYLGEIPAGAMVTFSQDSYKTEQLVPADPKFCVFEYVYFSHEKSNHLGQNVRDVRRRLGHQLAAEHQIEGDIIVPVPNGGIPGCEGLSEATGIPLVYGIEKKTDERVFIQPTQEIRNAKAREKFEVIKELVKDKWVVVGDDSIVRGTNTRVIVEMLIEAEAKGVSVASFASRIRYRDVHGIDIKTQAELIAHRCSSDAEIARELKARNVYYPSIEGMTQAIGVPFDRLSWASFLGQYPHGSTEREIDNQGQVGKLLVPVYY